MTPMKSQSQTEAVYAIVFAICILIALFRNKETVLADEIDLLKW